MSNQEGGSNVVLGLWEVYPPYLGKGKAEKGGENGLKPITDIGHVLVAND